MRAFLSHPQDVGVHLMTDVRWEPDTLFMVFEEEFRFTDTGSAARLCLPPASRRLG